MAAKKPVANKRETTQKVNALAHKVTTAAQRTGLLTKQLNTEKGRKQFTQLVTSLMTRREMAQKLGGVQFRGQRDLYEVCGYNRTLFFEDFQSAYDRDDVAKRIIDAPPESTWRRKPTVQDSNDPKEFTPFELKWADFCQTGRVFHYLERADKLAGIGEYGVIFLGTEDCKDASDLQYPMAKMRRGTKSILYLAPFTQRSAMIHTVETDPLNPRFSLPSMYEISVAGTSTNTVNMSPSMTVGSLVNQKLLIHWSRVIHIAEGLLENNYVGTPRLKPVMNRLNDLSKVVGGSAEIFWQAAKRIMILVAKEGYEAVDNDDQLTAMMDELIHGLRRTIDLQGYDVKTLDPSNPTPREIFDTIIALISSATGIPQRILIGSEEGKLASETDVDNWNGRIADRQLNFAEPVILRQFIDRLVESGALPPPKDGKYTITWPSLFEASDKEQAQTALLKARALRQYLGQPSKDEDPVEAFTKVQSVMSLEEFRATLNLRGRKLNLENVTQDDSGDRSGTTGDDEPVSGKVGKKKPSDSALVPPGGAGQTPTPAKVNKSNGKLAVVPITAGINPPKKIITAYKRDEDGLITEKIEEFKD